MYRLRSFAISNFTNSRISILFRAVNLLLRSVFCGGGTSCGTVRCRPAGKYADIENVEQFYNELLAVAAANRKQIDPIANRIVFLGGNRVPAGQDWKVVDTFVGLKRNGLDIQFLDISFGDAIGEIGYLDYLKKHGVTVRFLKRRATLAHMGVMLVPDATANLLEHMSEPTLEIILNLIDEFQTLQPEIVHIWLNETGVFSGIAAVIAGVPTVVLSCKNLESIDNSTNQHQLNPAYRALSKCPTVEFISNKTGSAQSFSDLIDASRRSDCPAP